ncbi:hypothetical protein [Paenibacillus macquariensis]|uniref:Uncharacterized protein n=1 Tax=Paenibacillus macquariensis TaxID=948756 RepID=A0ABY1JM28_9BACL|nr:hypothetical protein [Paenibacillus macquariensis]MEC0090600.1 hypothetical protein [Paenibacillus macquariensis]OAB25021.1 hypothetical protein PMSM_28735 [Paenibacillus macquariensis subsp. macquariensis]SIQ44610.1 hypothetical protein SAMN05421578_10226 [Paenibacillus macquariensis]
MYNENPFDRDMSDIIKPVISIFIHSNKLKADILVEESNVSKILKLGIFPFINVVCSPTEDTILVEKLQEYQGVKLTEYSYCDNEKKNFFTLKSENFEKIVLFGEEDKKNIKYKNSDISLLDIFAAEEFDYFVINDENPILNDDIKSQKNLVSPKYGMELIRLLLVNNKLFFVGKNFTVNEGYYYLYRFKTLFKKYQYAWSVVVSANSVISDDFFEQFSSLSQRLEFLCRTYDNLSFHDLKKANNDTQKNTLYHFAYFIMLVTGIFDDLAWIIKHLYELNLSKMEIGIKIPENKESTKFLNNLKLVNMPIYDYLTDVDTRNLIQLFYPLRDTLQHRSFLSGVRVKNNSKNIDKNLFAVPQKTVELIKNSSVTIDDFGIVENIGDSYYLDAHLFSYKAIQVVADIVNTNLSLIDLERILALLDEASILSLEQSNKDYENGLGAYLGWGSEPVYF